MPLHILFTLSGLPDPSVLTWQTAVSDAPYLYKKSHAPLCSHRDLYLSLLEYVLLCVEAIF